MTQKPSTRLVLLCGLPASGKTTLARQLAPKIPAIRLDKDQWTTQLGLDVWDDEYRVRLERQLWALTQDLLGQGQSVILEWGHWARVERDEKRLAARTLDRSRRSWATACRDPRLGPPGSRAYSRNVTRTVRA